ncbi:MAG: DinB family protein [Pyrinomonadaceae bacterium]|nr:DinB family protein [Pyrinomonadaceae bacterium]
MHIDHFVETWDIHNRINLYLLEAIASEHLTCVSASKGRSVGEQFAHIHNVRLLWLKQAAPEMLSGLEKVERSAAHDKALLQESLMSSGQSINQLLRKSVAAEGKVKGFKPHATAFLGYLISHESHHRGQIALTLKQDGHGVDKKILFGMWEWGVR